MAQVSDFVINTASGLSGVYIKFHNNVTGTDYVTASPTTSLGAFTSPVIPAGIYTRYWGLTAGSQTNLIDSNYVVNDNLALRTVATSGATQTLDRGVAGTHDVTLSANCAFTPAGAVVGAQASIDLIVRQPAAGGTYNYTISFVGVTWQGGTAPAMPTGASTLLLVNLLSPDGGTTWIGSSNPPKNTVTEASNTTSLSTLSPSNVTWVAVPGGPSLVLTPLANCQALLIATATTFSNFTTLGVDLGIYVSGGIYPTVSANGGTPEAWQEGENDGGFATQATTVTKTLAFLAGVTYTVTMRWKSTQAGFSGHTIFAGTGATANTITGMLFY